MSEPGVAAGMRAQLGRRGELLAAGAEPVGWKVGFNVPEIQARLGIDGPLAGFLTSAGLLDDGASWSLAGGTVLVEPEVAVEVGEAGRLAALLPALELVDQPDLSLDLETILGGNIFHRAVALGPRVETGAPGAARLLVNGEERHGVGAEQAGANLERMVHAVAGRLADAGEDLRPGDRIITGVVAPPYAARPGDRVRLELEALGGVELAFGA